MPTPIKLTTELMQQICARKRADSTLTQAQLAAEFGLSESSIKKALALLDLPEAPQSAPDSGITLLQFATIIKSPLNPRKTFPEEELRELAESIAVNGLLQNLVVRESGDTSVPNYYILVAGERRFRAISMLIAEHRWHGPIPCRIVEADDGTHLALALLENLQRQDVAPMEEAEAFAQLQALAPSVWTAKAIAEKIGRTPRYVYGRIAFATKLSPEAREALAKGRITVEAARLLVTAPREAQREILHEAQDYDDEDATQPIRLGAIQQAMSDTLMLVEDAIFDVAALQLETIEINGDVLFADTPAAITAQNQAIKLKAKDLKKHFDFVEMLETGPWFDRSLWVKPKEGRGGAVIHVSGEHKVTILEGVVKQERPQPAPFDRKAYEAKREQQMRDAEAKREEQDRKFRALCWPRPTDLEAESVAQGISTCRDGCKFRVMLRYDQPHEFHVCMNPESPRAGLLTHETQAGPGCFTVA